MSGTNDNSLLGFLQKKSLFSNSPNKNSRKRSRSKSRDSRNFDKRSNINTLDEASRVEEPRRQLFQEEPKLFNTFQQEKPKDLSPYRALDQPISQQAPSFPQQSFQQPLYQQSFQQPQPKTIDSPPRQQQLERT
jgi:hypothetical protein